ncbi:MAG TPA: hypothetical protein VGG99_14170 [Acetobacteraceae bacterium]|jgi:hypothetical protein
MDGSRRRITLDDAAACVGDLFSEVLLREPTPAEHRRWVNALRRGTAPATMRVAVMESEEYRQRDPVANLKAAIRTTGLFDAAWYRANYRDVAAAGFDPLDHYCRHGWLEHRAPNACFDDAWYRARTGISAETGALLDYAQRGEALGIPPGPNFDPAAYRAAHELDVATGALAHFLQHPEATAPPAVVATPRDLFDATWYLATYRDVASAGHDPFDHYARHGHLEGRAPNRYFDPEWYRDHRGLGTDADLLADYLEHGEQAGIAPGPQFDPAWYRAAYRLDGTENALAHFLRHRGSGDVAPCPRLWSLTHRAGADADPFLPFLAPKDEVDAAAADIALLACSGLFDANFYQVTNADVFSAGIEPLAHFCAFGWKENRQPNFYFNLAWYSATNPDVQRLQVNPLVHYCLVGEAADRRPVVYFEPGWYRRTYGLAADGSPLAHYLANRRTQKYSPNSLFDPAWYIAHCDEKLHARRDVFAHYLVAGMQKDVPPSAQFDAAAWRRRTRGRATRRFRHGQSPERDNPLVSYMLTHYR